jgi:hypothetical protein
MAHDSPSPSRWAFLRRDSSLSLWLGGPSEQEEAAHGLQREGSNTSALSRRWSSAAAGGLGQSREGGPVPSPDAARRGASSVSPRPDARYVGRASSGSIRGARSASVTALPAAPPVPSDEQDRIQYGGRSSGSGSSRGARSPALTVAAPPVPSDEQGRIQYGGRTSSSSSTGWGLLRRLSSTFASPAVEVPDGAASAQNVTSPTGGLGFFGSVSATFLGRSSGSGSTAGGSAWTEAVTKRDAISSPEDYALQHMGIKSAEFKPTALHRIKDMARLFQSLQDSGTVRLIAAGPGRTNSIFGFERIYVDEIADFSQAFARLVTEDRDRCWHANGRKTITCPTSPCYELVLYYVVLYIV